MPSDPNRDLDWLAFRYISGEMTAEEADAFECRLADDQGAREAVAQAVALTAAVSLAAPSTREVLPLRRRRLVSTWVIVAASAACLALLAWPLFRSDAQRRLTPAVAESDARSPEIALTWSDLRQSGEAGASASADGLAFLDEDAAETDTIASNDINVVDDAVPHWLLEAASLRESTRPDGSAIKEN